MSEFLSFRSMVTPAVIQIIFWLVVLGNVVAAIGLFAKHHPGLGLLVLIGGPLLTRIYCELLIIIFRMHETLKTIGRNTTVLSPVEAAFAE